MTAFLRRNPWRPIALEVVLNRPGQLGRQLRVLQPTMAVVTSVGTEHIRSFPGGIEAIRNEKVLAVRALPAHGVAILNDGNRLPAVGRLCHRSARGFATSFRWCASCRTITVKAAAAPSATPKLKA